MELFNKTLSLFRTRKHVFSEYDDYNINKLLFGKDDDQDVTLHKIMKRLPSIDINDMIVPQTNETKNKQLLCAIDAMLLQINEPEESVLFCPNNENVPPNSTINIRKIRKLPKVIDETTEVRERGKVSLRYVKLFESRKLKHSSIIEHNEM